MTLDAKCRDIRLILSDVDGVLTDGGILYDNHGIEAKRFHIRDGLGIKLWQSIGYHFGLVSARSSQIVMARAAELGIGIVRQGVDQKLPMIQEIALQLSLEPRHVCYMGDDLPDMAAMRWAGLGVTVADAPDQVREAADYTTRNRGGEGALRELIELILLRQGRWEHIVERFSKAP